MCIDDAASRALTPVAERRVRVLVTGIVQGVGFRPFIYNLAVGLDLGGFVRNDPQGVTIEVEGAADAVEAFLSYLVVRPPPLARIESLTPEELVPLGAADGGRGFAIAASEAGAGERIALVSPDVASCDECLAELRDPAARRFGYAFTNCTNCGPRFTITTGIPYDRPNTTMAPFAMCAECRAEYEDPANRRFHAQPIACPVCGPLVSMGGLTGPPAIQACARSLADGKVVALKGLGGYHLACDASNRAAVDALRSRKVREEKPFAVMAGSLEALRLVCDISAEEAALLSGHRRPIVLLGRSSAPTVALAEGVAPRNRCLGAMLPYTPLHSVLLDAFAALAAEQGGPGILVMTSGNRSDEPIAYEDGDAAGRLGPIADAALTHNRPIHMRCDDSVTRVYRGEEYLIRRARGYAPEPLLLQAAFPMPVLAVGAELKHTFCLGAERRAFVSHHIGDLENYETMRSFIEGVAHYCRIFSITPDAVAYDLHPEYLSTKWALDQVSGEAEPPPGIALEGCELVGVQHHHAHIASCMADNGIGGQVIGLALDGTGWGSDGTLWGCEVLVAGQARFRRAGHLRTVPLPGGAAAIKEPWRMAAVYLEAAFGAVAAAELRLPFVAETAGSWGRVLELAAKGINAPVCSSAGRLFDAAAALAGLRSTVVYEGQAAIELEQASDPGERSAYPCPVGGAVGAPGGLVVDGVALVAALAEDLASGSPVAVAGARFHNGLAGALVACCTSVREATGLTRVALSGGTFQNLLLLEAVTAGLESAGFEVYRHRRVPANDGGISLGQAAVAAARIAGGSDDDGS
ncbi:MAG TPA: carbamoyltransferase HypF [Actinomycetota bacterium]|nr:carbamoyltransferase HypF [Actinomycetota bacterium]